MLYECVCEWCVGVNECEWVWASVRAYSFFAYGIHHIHVVWVCSCESLEFVCMLVCVCVRAHMCASLGGCECV